LAAARISGWAVLKQLRKIALGISRRRQKAAGFGLFLSARRWEPELSRLSPEDWSRGGRRGLNLLHERRDGSLEPAELAVKLFDHLRGPLGDREGAANYPVIWTLRAVVRRCISSS